MNVLLMGRVTESHTCDLSHKLRRQLEMCLPGKICRTSQDELTFASLSGLVKDTNSFVCVWLLLWKRIVSQIHMIVVCHVLLYRKFRNCVAAKLQRSQATTATSVTSRDDRF